MSILITQSALLAATVAYPFTNARIGHHTITRDGTLTASTDQTGSPAYAAGLPNTYESWIPNEVPAWIQVDHGSSIVCDYIGIAAHDIGTTGANIAVQYSSDGISWSDAVTSTAFTDDTPIMIFFDEINARYWRLYITGAIPTIGVWYVGKALAMQRAVYGGHSPITLSRNNTVRANTSEGGQFLGRYIVRSSVETTAKFQHLTASWYRSYFDKFVLSARQYPFFFAWRPTDYPREVAYAWTTGDIRPANMGIGDLMEVSFNMKGIGAYEGSDVNVYPGGS